MDDFNMYAVEKFASPSERKFHRSIRSFEQNFFQVQPPPRYSNFVYDNSIREIIIFVTIVTKKEKKIQRNSSIVTLLNYPSRIKIVYTIWGNITYRNQHISGKNSQRYRLVVFLSRTLIQNTDISVTIPCPNSIIRFQVIPNNVLNNPFVPNNFFFYHIFHCKKEKG